MLKIGITGMPNAGKSTLFNTLSESNATVAPYPFSTVDPNKAMVNIYDQRFEELGRALNAPDLKYSQAELWDIAGLIEGASDGEGLGNEFLGQMKSSNLLLHVVRINHDTTEAEALNNLGLVNREIASFDHHLLLKPFEKARRYTRLYPKNPEVKHQSTVLTSAYYGTRDGTSIREVVEESDFVALDDIGLISLKPQLLVANTDGSESAKRVAQAVSADIQLNAEEMGQLRGLTAEDRLELGFQDGEVEFILQSMFASILLAARMKRVYTVGHLGVGQWIAEQSASALECAALLHDDMEAHTTNVRVSSTADFEHFKNWQDLNRAGKTKLYSAKKYIPADGEVLLYE